MAPRKRGSLAELALRRGPGLPVNVMGNTVPL